MEYLSAACRAEQTALSGMRLGSDYLAGIQGLLEIPLVLDLYYLSFRLFFFLITSLPCISRILPADMVLSYFESTLSAVLYEPVDTTARELCKGNFSLYVKGFVQGILSNVFHKSDFVTNFATTGMMFILSPSSVDCLVYIRKGVENKMKDNPKVNAKKPLRHGRVDSHAGSDDAKVAARSMQNTAKMTAKKGKNETQAPTRSLSKKAGTESHKIVYDAKTGGHSAEPDNAMADAHNPHKHAGIASYKLSHDSKAGAQKAVSAGAKVAASKTLKITGVKAKKESGTKKTGTHKTVKSGFVANIEEETRKNKDFRRVLYTGENCQFVLMSLKPMEDIGMETHDTVDQFFRFEEGNGSVVINGKKHAVKDGGGVIVPCGAAHNVINTSKTAALKLYTIYSPPNHLDKVVRKTKQEALAKEEHFDGKTTE